MKSGSLHVPLALAGGVGAVIALLTIWLSVPQVRSYEDSLRIYAFLDPPIGSRFTLPRSVAMQPGEKVLILLLGNCAGCSVVNTDFRSMDLSAWKRVVVVATSDQWDDARLPISPHVIKVRYDHALHEGLNAYFTPRLAVVQGYGTLIALQDKSESCEQFVERVRR